MALTVVHPRSMKRCTGTDFECAQAQPITFQIVVIAEAAFM